MADQRHLGRMGLVETARALREGRATSQARVERAIEAHDRLEPELHAFVAFDAEGALAQARAADEHAAMGGPLAPLHGIPISAKDHFGVERFPVWAGTARELPERFRGEGPVVAGIRRQRAVIPGKTIAVELAFGGLGTNPHWGTPRNPWDAAAHRVPGGSSAGAGVSLWQGSALLALGTDTAGSSRIPAAWTGTVGLKTTRGRWPTDGVVPLSPTLDTVGILARTVADAIWAFAALDPELSRDTTPGELLGRCLAAGPPRLGVVREQLWDDCSPGVAEAVEEALSELARRGLSVGEAALPETREAEALLRSGSVVSAELAAFLSRELPGWTERLDPTVASRIADGAGIPAEEVAARRALLGDLARRAPTRFEGFDLLVCPTVPNTPPVLEALGELRAYRRQNFLALRNTCVANFLGLSALTLPVGLDAARMPVGLQLFAPAREEVHLLAAGLALETRLGSAWERLGRPPAVPG